MMQRKFAQTVDELRGLINEWSAPPRILLAVSGGIDSMCMAELFASLEIPVPFALAHCNFHLRGEESDGDERLVRNWAAEHGVVCHVNDFDTEKYASEKGISIEMAARELRYSWFAGLCRENGYCALAVAHNANDNAETLMLNLLRGSGLKGLGGMSVVSRLNSICPSGHDEETILFRPLLSFTRKQIEGFVFSNKIPYRNDSTNALSDYKRNRIRNEAFPVFSKINPSFIRTLNKDMEYFAEAREIVDDWCRSVLPSVITSSTPSSVPGCPGIRISIPALLAHKRWHYLLYHILEPYGFNSSVLMSVEALLESSRTISGKCFMAKEHVLYTGRGELIVEPSGSVVSGEADLLTVNGDGIYGFGNNMVEVERVRRISGTPLKQPAGTLILDADKLSYPFFLRRWQTGDWMVPFGMKGKKKVSDVFADLKYDAFQKQSAVIISYNLDCKHVAGIAGVRIDDAFKVTDDTASVIRIRII